MFFKALFIDFWLITVLYAKENTEDVSLITKIRTSFLEKYTAYVDIVTTRIIIPEDTSFASIKFIPDEIGLSFFGCSPRDISIYMKEGAYPVINPDNATFSKLFKDVSRQKLYNFTTQTNKIAKYINITSPVPGNYFIATFLSYTDPSKDPIKQQGLTPKCGAFVDISLYISKQKRITTIIENEEFKVNLSNQSLYYKFQVPSNIDFVYIRTDVPANGNIRFRYNTHTVPRNDSFSFKENLKGKQNKKFKVVENYWYYIELSSEGASQSAVLSIRFLKEINSCEGMDTGTDSLYKTAKCKMTDSSNAANVVPFKEYDLLKESSSESFLYVFDIENTKFEDLMPVSLNLTSDGFSMLKFMLSSFSDIGGTLQYSVEFKPNVTKSKTGIKINPTNQMMTVLGCISRHTYEIPTWPNQCVSPQAKTSRIAPIKIDKKDDNSSILIPFPESGQWFATLKAYCGPCVPCNCSSNCQLEYVNCKSACDNQCIDEPVSENCNCSVKCKKEVLQNPVCVGCDCDGPCIRSKEACDVKVVFDLSSYPCVLGECGVNGQCAYVFFNGFIYSTCICHNKYRGWDCSDSSQAKTYGELLLELLLLVLSNLIFLPTSYVAYRRKYYTESLVYFSTFFFSTFYHSCDSGDNIISFCLARLGTLQFGDFYSALMSIWVTMVAIADTPFIYTSLLQMLGAILLAFFTAINKTALWVIVVPVVSGVITLAVSWGLKFRKVRQWFVQKRYVYVYLPAGIGVVTLGLVIYSFLQTVENYKYLHSLWHITMGVAVVIVLPQRDTFKSSEL